MDASVFRLLSREEFKALNPSQQRVYLGMLLADLLEKIAEVDLRPSDALPGPVSK